MKLRYPVFRWWSYLGYFSPWSESLFVLKEELRVYFGELNLERYVDSIWGEFLPLNCNSVILRAAMTFILAALLASASFLCMEAILLILILKSSPFTVKGLRFLSWPVLFTCSPSWFIYLFSYPSRSSNSFESHTTDLFLAWCLKCFFELWRVDDERGENTSSSSYL